LPIALVAAVRPAEPQERSPLLAPLTAGPATEVIAPAPLSEPAVAELVRREMRTEVASSFASACYEVPHVRLEDKAVADHRPAGLEYAAHVADVLNAQ
jgi:hypothetical protein